MTTCFMDTATAKLAVELQLRDISDLLDGLYDENELPEGDERLSFQVTQRDLYQQLQILEGQTLVFKILREEHNNRVAFSRLLEEERRAAADHQLAMRLAGMTNSDPEVKQGADYEANLCEPSECDIDEQWDMAKELYATAFEKETADREPLNGIRTVKAGEVKANSKSKILGSKDLTKCCSCMEAVPSKATLTLACKPEAHTYCRACLVDLFTSAISNPTLFPPRCCRLPIPLDTCRATLPKELIKKFDLKVEELATPNPTHCSNPDCSEFISPKNIKAEVGNCVYCKDKTCARCKNAAHKGLCPSDPHVQLLMDFAKRSKWQQCTKCKNMVELIQGCFHMTYIKSSYFVNLLVANVSRCRCGHQFCYLCGEKWKKCSCPQADENYLTLPLPAIPGAFPVPVPAPVAARPRAVLGPHVHTWERVESPDCAGCRAGFLPFVMRCRLCNVANCWRCIHNRG
jgi:E3 ubiquitin-protein ligase RNF144